MPKKLYNEPSPLETRVVSKNFGLENSESLDTYLANDGFVAKAPPHVVQAERDKLARLREELQAL